MLDTGLYDEKNNSRSSLDGFASSPSNEPQTLESEQILHNSFKAAAVSITQMYRESQKLRNQCLVEGYEQCLRDIWTYAASSTHKRSDDPTYCGLNLNNKLTVEVTELLASLTKRSALLRGPRSQADKEPYSQKRQDNFTQQGRIFPGPIADPMQRQRSQNSDQMDVNNYEPALPFTAQNVELRFGQGKCAGSEDSIQNQQTNKRKEFTLSEPQLDSTQPRFNRQYAFIGNKNSHMYHDSFQRKVRNGKLFDY